eukprot:TRINITY_DN8111_c0_g1_i1.p1 TRINITY_DN8111_c0_g1~~TRINITY_DN8111_c0_g1_i1.p1  ORF type:complete len:475 (+),score=180.64 TRINITY_DN8111_c0_g1_i1:97-1425(+)
MPGRTIPKNVKKLIAHWVDIKPGSVFSLTSSYVRFREPTTRIEAEPTPPTAAAHDDAPTDNKSCVYLVLFQGSSTAAPGHPFSSAIKILTKENHALFGGLCPSTDRKEMISCLVEHVKKQTHGCIDLSSVQTWYKFYELQRSGQIPIVGWFPAFWEITSTPYLSPADGSFTPLSTLLDQNASFIPALTGECVAEFVQRECVAVVREFLEENTKVDKTYKEVVEEQEGVLREKKEARKQEMDEVREKRNEEKGEKDKVYEAENEGLTSDEIAVLDEKRAAERGEMEQRWRDEDMERRKRWREEDEADPNLKRRKKTTLMRNPAPATVTTAFAVFDTRSTASVPSWVARTAILNSDDSLTLDAASDLTRTLPATVFYKTALKSLAIKVEEDKEDEEQDKEKQKDENQDQDQDQDQDHEEQGQDQEDNEDANDDHHEEDQEMDEA